MGLGGSPRHAEPLSPFLATVAVMKAIVGLCCLTLPAVFAAVGLTLAMVGLLLVCVALGVGTYRVAQCYVQIREGQTEEAEFHGLGPLGDISREVFGSAGFRCCYVAILASQFGIAVAYIDVIVPTAMHLLGLTKLTVQLWLIGISWAGSLITEMKGLAFLSIVALSAFMYIVVALAHFGIAEIRAGRDSFEDAWLPLRFEGLGAFLGPTITAFEGVVVSQYAFADMQLDDPAPFKRVVLISHAFALVLFGFIGVVGYGVYGDGVSEVIYESFPADSLDVRLCKTTVCLVQLINFQVQMYPIFSVGETLLRSWFPEQDPGSNLCSSEEDLDINAQPSDQEFLKPELQPAEPTLFLVLRLVLRWSVIALAFLVAAAVPSVNQVLSYIGGYCFAYVALFLPGLAHWRMNSGRLSVMDALTNVTLVFMGAMSAVLTTLG